MYGRVYFIFGLQRSGTNFLEQLIRSNYNRRPMNNATFWKHSIVPPDIDDDHPLLLIHKNPYTWIESICYRNEVDWRKRQTDYIITEELDEGLKAGEKGYSIKVLAQAYNDFYTNWHERIKTSNAIVIKYENLLESSYIPEMFKKIDSKFQWQNNGSLVTPKKVSQSPDYTKARGEYYKNNRPAHLTRYQIDCINKTISDNVFALNRYQKL